VPPLAANGITLQVELAGDPEGSPLLLLHGLGAQLIDWPEGFVAALVERGFLVIRCDNRDVGRSTWFDDAGPPDPLGVLTGEATAPYLLADMADDAAGVLDGLNLERADVVGVSMGGMIAQCLAIRHPRRVRSLVSIMSTTGDPSVGRPHPGVAELLLTPPAADRAEAVEQSVAAWRATASTGFPLDEAAVRERAGRAFDRGYHPDGTGRQLVAVLASGDRTAELRGLDVPTLVVHGEADPLVDVSGGRATAAAIPGARLRVIPGMGHDLPDAVIVEVVEEIARHAGGHAGRSPATSTGSPA